MLSPGLKTGQSVDTENDACFSLKLSPAPGMPEGAHVSGADSLCLGACGPGLHTRVAEHAAQRLTVLHRPWLPGTATRVVNDLFMAGFS